MITQIINNAESYTIFGYLKYRDNGKPNLGCRVILYSETDGVKGRASTDKYGYYEFVIPKPVYGKFTVQFYGSKTIQALQPNGDWEQFEITVQDVDLIIIPPSNFARDSNGNYPLYPTVTLSEGLNIGDQSALLSGDVTITTAFNVTSFRISQGHLGWVELYSKLRGQGNVGWRLIDKIEVDSTKWILPDLLQTDNSLTGDSQSLVIKTNKLPFVPDSQYDFKVRMVGTNGKYAVQENNKNSDGTYKRVDSTDYDLINGEGTVDKTNRLVVNGMTFAPNELRGMYIYLPSLSGNYVIVDNAESSLDIKTLADTEPDISHIVVSEVGETDNRAIINLGNPTNRKTEILITNQTLSSYIPEKNVYGLPYYEVRGKEGMIANQATINIKSVILSWLDYSKYDPTLWKSYWASKLTSDLLDVNGNPYSYTTAGVKVSFTRELAQKLYWFYIFIRISDTQPDTMNFPNKTDTSWYFLRATQELSAIIDLPAGKKYINFFVGASGQYQNKTNVSSDYNFRVWQ